MKVVAIKGEARTELGKKASKAIKAEGKVPCVIYGSGENVHFTGEPLAFRDIIYTGEFKLVEISIDGKTYKCILKDAQFHPVTDSILHLDFLQLVDGKNVIAQVPVRLVGTSPGAKLGGKVLRNLKKIKIKTVPEKLVDELTLDISELQLGGAVRVRDVEIPEGIEVMNDGGIPVATMVIPRALRSAEAKKEAEAAGQEAVEAAE